MGSGKPELESERALMDQHGETVVGATAFALGELQQGGQRRLIDRIVNEVGLLEAVVGQDGRVARLEPQ